MSLKDDRKRGQVLTGAKQLAFKGAEMQRLLASPDFTVIRCKVQLNRLIALAADVQRQNQGGKTTDEDAAILQDGKNAQELLDIIEKPIAGQS